MKHVNEYRGWWGLTITQPRSINGAPRNTWRGPFKTRTQAEQNSTTVHFVKTKADLRFLRPNATIKRNPAEEEHYDFPWEGGLFVGSAIMYILDRINTSGAMGIGYLLASGIPLAIRLAKGETHE